MICFAKRKELTAKESRHKNFLFVNARAVDSKAYGAEEAIEAMRTDATVSLNFFVNFCHSYGLAAKSYLGFGTDAVEELNTLSERIREEFPNAIFFTSKLIMDEENFFTRLLQLHNQAALTLQRGAPLGDTDGDIADEDMTVGRQDQAGIPGHKEERSGNQQGAA